MGIPFVKTFDFEYGKCQPISPLIDRVIADNPGPFTFTGTGVYIIGDKDVAVIDPGPQTPNHVKALKNALKGRRVTHVLVTHHHIDHSPMAAPLAKEHGCQVHGFGLQIRPPKDGDVRLEAGDDVSFMPDIEIRDGHVIHGDGWTIEAIHTPGHTSNHMCYTLREENTLFSGDHIMGWSTSVVSPPDGHMGDYLKSLNRILDRKFDRIIPTHGTVIEHPEAFVSAYIEHRLERERQICAALETGITQISNIVALLYQDIDKRLHPAAAHSVLSHLIRLREIGVIDGDGPDGLRTDYALKSTD